MSRPIVKVAPDAGPIVDTPSLGQHIRPRNGAARPWVTVLNCIPGNRNRESVPSGKGGGL